MLLAAVYSNCWVWGCFLSEHVASDRMVRWGPASVLGITGAQSFTALPYNDKILRAHRQYITTICLEGQPAQQPRVLLSSNLVTFCSLPQLFAWDGRRKHARCGCWWGISYQHLVHTNSLERSTWKSSIISVSHPSCHLKKPKESKVKKRLRNMPQFRPGVLHGMLEHALLYLRMPRQRYYYSRIVAQYFR